MATQRIRKTKLMRSVEEKHGRQLESLVPFLGQRNGNEPCGFPPGSQSRYPRILDVKNGIQYRGVALADGETIEVRRQG